MFMERPDHKIALFTVRGVLCRHPK